MNAKARILVIDDDELVLATIRIMLTRARYDVALAASGDDGIAQLGRRIGEIEVGALVEGLRDDAFQPFHLL